MLLVMAFEATNGFHDAANAVATVIYTNSLKPAQAALLSDDDVVCDANGNDVDAGDDAPRPLVQRMLFRWGRQR